MSAKKAREPVKTTAISEPSPPVSSSQSDATHTQHKEAFDALLDLTAKPRSGTGK